MKYDLHCHTYHSPCSNLRPEVILRKAKQRGLNGIAITDHNSIKGAYEVAALNKDSAFEVIIGEEVKTDSGEVLALYIKKEIKPGPIDKVLTEIHRQGGIAILAHPYTVGLWRKKTTIELSDYKNKIDAIEGMNGRCFFKFENLRAQIKAKELGITMTAGSDSHFATEIGKCYTEFYGDLRKAIKERKTNIHGTTKGSLKTRLLSLAIKVFGK